MNRQDGRKEFPELNLDLLASQINTFLVPYPFVASVTLHHGGNKQRYHIVFNVPGAPDSKIVLYEEFYTIIEGPMEFGPLQLDKVYQRGSVNPEPLGSSGYYDWPWREWSWSIAGKNNRILPEFGSMERLVLPDDPVVLYGQSNTKGDKQMADQKTTDISSATAPPVETSITNSFIRKGEFWQVRYKEKETIVRDLNGIRYIALLLERPGRSISCRELYGTALGIIPDNVISQDVAIAEGLDLQTSTQMVNDEDTKKAYLKKYQKLQNELADVKDTPEDAAIKKEIEKEMTDLLSALKEKHFTDPDRKKVQDNVKGRLDKAFSAIGDAGLKKLQQHLRTSIKPGGSYDFVYVGSIIWSVSR